jgi:hypothetical protein
MSNPNPSPLTRFRKGQSGNPGARSTFSLTRLVRAELQKPAEKGSGVTRGEVVASKVVDLAVAGKEAFVKMVWEYIDGKPMQPVDWEAEIEKLAKLGFDRAQLEAVADRLKAG